MSHGENDEKWMIYGDVIWGDPTGDFVWNQAKKIILKPWELSNGREVSIACTFVDSGYLTPDT